jgi:uncharacterized protein YutE (UPF0331/DUF86 family)
MEERILEHLKRLNPYRLRLLEMKQLTPDEFLQDDMRQAAVERLLHLAIESGLNIGNRLVSPFQFEKAIETPEMQSQPGSQAHLSQIRSHKPSGFCPMRL